MTVGLQARGIAQVGTARGDRRILVVTNDPSLQAGIVEALSRRGVQLHLVEDREEYLASSSRETFDAILLDLSGTQESWCRELLEQNVGRCAVVVTVAEGREAEALDAMEHGADAYLVRPHSAEQAAKHLESQRIDLIVCDQNMPGMSGIDFLAGVAKDYPDIIRIMLTGEPSLDTAMRAINEGKVYHFFTKPCNEIDLAVTIRHALQQKALIEKSRGLLEVTKSQSALIDKARIARRLKGIPQPSAGDKPDDQSLSQSTEATDPNALLDEIEHEICRGRNLITSLTQSLDS